MNILADFHHADLWWSLDLLAKRLGANLYRPIGVEWYDEGYFRLYEDPRRRDPARYLAKQYLSDTMYTYNPEKDLVRGRETYNGCVDYPLFHVLTLKQAKNFPIDIVICSVHENEPYFAKLREFYPNAKFIRQVGNDLDTIIDTQNYPNLLASATKPYEAFEGHKVLYRQEFDLNLFQYMPPSDFNRICSFQNDIEQFEDMWAFWTELKHALPEYTFRSYGVGCEDGKIYSKRIYIEMMLRSTFLVQSKGPWEGYGHGIHNAMCLGRPMIIKRSDYAGKLAEPMLKQDETYLEMTDPEIIEKIRFYSRPDRLSAMSHACRRAFEEHVNFDEEFIQIKKFMEELK